MRTPSHAVTLRTLLRIKQRQLMHEQQLSQSRMKHPSTATPEDAALLENPTGGLGRPRAEAAAEMRRGWGGGLGAAASAGHAGHSFSEEGELKMGEEGVLPATATKASSLTSAGRRATPEGSFSARKGAGGGGDKGDAWLIITDEDPQS